MKQHYSMRALLFSVAFIIGSHSFAQVYMGVKAGVSIPNLHTGSSNPVATGWSSRLAPCFGLVSEVILAKQFSIQTELNYSSQGGKRYGLQGFDPSSFFTTVPPGTPQYVYLNIKNDFKLNYLELPVMAKYNLPAGKKFSFFVEAGPYAGYLLNAKIVTSGVSKAYADKDGTLPLSPQSYDFGASTNAKDQIKKFNVGLQGGLGLVYKIGKGFLQFTAGGNYGFVKIQKDKSDGSNNTGAAIATLAYSTRIFNKSHI